MDSLSDYEAWKAKRQDDSVGAAQVVLGSLDTKPDEAAGDLNLASEFGKVTGNPVPPPPMVKEYRNVFQQAVERERTKTVLSSAPVLTQWLRNPDNAVVASDDLENLSWWDRFARNVKEVPKGVPGGVVSAGGTALEGAGQMLTPVNPAARNAIASTISTAQAMKPEDIAALRTELFKQGDINPAYAQSILSDVISGDMTPADAMEALGPQFGPILKAASEAFQAGGEKTQEFGQSILPAAPGMENSLGRQVGSGLGSFITILGVGALTGGFGGGTFAGALGAGEAVANARQAGADEDTQTIAAVYGVLPGLTDMIPVERLLSNPATKAGFAAFLRSVGLQAATEGGQEAVQQIMQNAIAQNLYAPNAGLFDQVMDNFAAGGLVGALTEAGKAALEAALPGRFHVARGKAERAVETQQKIAEVSTQAQASALRTRAPDKFRQFVEEAGRNGPNENVYVPAEQFVQYFQGIGVDPRAIVNELEGVTVDDLDAAIAGGGDLKIPTATYAAKIAGSEHDPFLMENMRFDPNEFTAREAAEFNAKAEDAMHEAFEEAERIRLHHEELRSFEQEIYDTMVSRLRAAGRSTDVATTEALLYPAFYRTMAERSNMTVEDFARAYPLPKVEGSLPQGMQFKDTDALTRTLAEARAQRSAGLEKRGPTLLEFIDSHGGINDPGGNLRAMDAETVKRGRGKKSLRLARNGIVAGVRDMFGGGSGKKFGVDDVAQAAIEAGYLRDDPVANEYRAAVAEGRQVPNIGSALWDAIRREVSGQADYATEAPAKNEADFDQIEQYLSSLGVSLEDDDAAIRQAVEAAQADDGRKYAQSGGVTQTEAFKRWFGDSKVVDDAGNPLAVYHGTNQPIEQFDITRGGIATGANAGATKAFFFTDSKSVADQYALNAGERVVSNIAVFEKEQARLKREVDRLERAAQRTGNWDAYEAAMTAWEDLEIGATREDASVGANVVEAYLSLQNPMIVDLDGGRLTDAQDMETLIDQAKAARHDGLIVRNLEDSPKMGIVSTHYVAFEPTQIKSVDNRGAFDPSDARLLFQSANELPLNAADVARSKPDGIIFERDGVVISKRGDEILASVDGAKAGQLSLSWRAPYATSVEVDAKFRRRGVATKLYDAAEEVIGRKLFPSPLGMSDDAIRFWKRRLSNLDGAEKQALLSEAVTVGASAGVARSATERMVRLGYTAGDGTAIEPPFYASRSMDDLVAEMRSRRETRGRIVAALASGTKSTRMENDSGLRVFVGPNTVQGERPFRISYFDAKGEPTGHSEYDTYEKAIDDAVTYGYRPIDRAGIRILYQDQLSPRGSISFPAEGVGNGDTVIRLFQSADLSTMLHESGHYFLTVLRDLASKGETAAATDFEAVKGWWRENAGKVAKDANRATANAGVSSDDVIRALDTGTTGDAAKDAAIDVGMQEQFARGFEAYLMEGKAPNAELRTAFEKFRAWLFSVYQKLAGLNVTVSDDIRNVFDRMIATDNEIAKAREQTGNDAALFPDAASMGLTEDEYSKFLKLRSQAEDESKARLLREIMEPVKRQQEEWFKAERSKVRDDVERQVNAYRYYRALEWMGNRRWLGEGQPEDMPDIRLSKDMLVERYGEGVLKTLPRGKQTVYAVDGGADPDEAAGWFGFDSGDEMIRALEKAPSRREAIEAETDRVMRERHGDPLNDGSVEADALEALHTDKRGQWIAAELKAVTEVAGVAVPLTAKEARAAARQTLARTRVRDAVNSSRFLAAERKAADEAAGLGAILAREGVWMNSARRRVATKVRGAIRGDGTTDAVVGQVERANASTGNYNETVARLIDAKRRQLLNHALYMESRKVAEEVEKAERYIDRLTKATTRERIAGAGRREDAALDYLGAIDDILDRYDFRRMSGTAEQRRGSLNAFIAAMTAAGRENELAIPDRVLQDATKKPYKTLPVEELRGVIDSLKNLEHIATRWNKLIDAQKERDLDAAVDEVVGAMDANLPKRPPGRVGTKGEAARHAIRQYIDLALNAGTMLREIDGFADLGPAYRNIKSPIDDAMNRLIVRKEGAASDLEKLYDVYSKAERRAMGTREHMPELGYALSKWERIGVALNTGNAGNYQRMTDGRVRGSLTEAQVTAVLATLDERDARFVQSAWDYLETFRDDIAARERRATGVEPAWVEAQPVEIGGITLKGGYYPLKYDARLSSLARDDEAAISAQSIQSGRFGKAQTRNGHLKERAQASGRAVDLDMSVLHRHVNQVIYDLELSEPVANGWKILQNGRTRSAFIDAGRQADFDALEIWLQDVGNGELRSADFVGRAARMLKSNFTAAKLAFNLVTVATQVAGLSQTAVVVGKRDFVRGLSKSFRNGLASEIAAKSPFMASRQTTFNKDIYDFYTDPKTGPVASRWGDIKKDVIGPLAFWLMTKVQWHLADVPTWMAGYEQGLRKFDGNEADAVAHADAVVKRAQASGLFADRSAIERGSVSRTTRQNDVIRLFTALGSYMFAKFNVAYERSAKSSRLISQEGVSMKSAQEALSWTLDMTFLFAVETIIIGAIKGGLPGMGDDDKEDEGWGTFLARETAFNVLGTLPFIRDGAGAYQGFTAGGAYGGIVNDAVRGVKGATNILAAPFTEDGEVKPSDIKAVIGMTGLATGLPASQINRAVDAAMRQADGQEVSPLEYLLGKKAK